MQLGKAASRLTDALQAWQPARVTAAVELLTDWGRIQEAAEHMAVPFSLTQEVARAPRLGTVDGPQGVGGPSRGVCKCYISRLIAARTSIHDTGGEIA